MFILKAVRTLLLCLLLILGGVFLLQDRLLYFPDNPPQHDIFAEASRYQLTPWPSSTDYRALVRTPQGPVRCTIVLFHGNAGHAGHRAWYADLFAAQGCRLVLAEYPGYGSRPGSPGEASLVADGIETLARIRARYPEPVVLAGESLGAAVAAAVAPVTRPEALLLITPWDRLAAVAAYHYPWLPVSGLLRDDYDSLRHLQGYPGRTALIVAGQDRIVPARYGLRLFESLGQAKHLLLLPGADHNNWDEHMEPGQWQALLAMLLP